MVKLDLEFYKVTEEDITNSNLNNYSDYFVTKNNIHKYITHGTYLFKITVTQESNISIDSLTMRYRAECVKIVDKYYVLSPGTVILFDLPISNYYLDKLSRLGDVNTLILWQKSGLPLKYSFLAIDFASKNNFVTVLEWWQKTGLVLDYSETSIDVASSRGHTQILEWWKNSGLKLKYTHFAMDNASKNGYVQVLDWWKNSGLEMKYTSMSMDDATRNNSILVLEWWVNSGLKLKYTRKVINDVYISNICSEVVEWWKNYFFQLILNNKLLIFNN